MLQYKYCIIGWKASWLGGKLYRNTVHCIAAKRGLKGWVLYYNTLLCIARDLAGEAGWVTIQTLYRDCSHWKGKGKRLECIARKARDTAEGQATTRSAVGHDTARRGHAWVGWLGQQAMHLVHPACF